MISVGYTSLKFLDHLVLRCYNTTVVSHRENASSMFSELMTVSYMLTHKDTEKTYITFS